MKNNTKMITWIYAAALILLGGIGYVVTGMQSVTALIPAFFGIVVIVVSFILKSSKKVNLILLILGVLGVISTVSGIPKVIDLMSGQEIERQSAAISQAIMSIVSLIYSVILLMKLKQS